MTIDLNALTDDEIKQLRVDVLTAIERRENVKRIPGQVADLCRTYRDGGGDPAVLEQAVTGEVDSDDRA